VQSEQKIAQFQLKSVGGQPIAQTRFLQIKIEYHITISPLVQ
jgi:hypothetical protein